MVSMGLSIKNDETQRLARELAGATGETITTAITVAVRERLERLHTGDGVAHRRDRLHRLACDAAPRWNPHLATREHGDVLYDDEGLPR
jgi:antitoxin VapB